MKLYILWVWFEDDDFPEKKYKTLDSIHDTWSAAFDYSDTTGGVEFEIEVRELRTT